MPHCGLVIFLTTSELATENNNVAFNFVNEPQTKTCEIPRFQRVRLEGVSVCQGYGKNPRVKHRQPLKGRHKRGLRVGKSLSYLDIVCSGILLSAIGEILLKNKGRLIDSDVLMRLWANKSGGGSNVDVIDDDDDDDCLFGRKLFDWELLNE